MVRILASVFMALLGSGLLQGAILTVGPSGTYPTINQAISASVVGQDTEIRVEGGKQYFENVLIPDSFSSGSIEMTGGWDSTFSVRETDPSDTTIDGLTAVRPLEIRITGGTFTLEGFTIKNGVAFGSGGGILVFPPGNRDVVITLKNTHIIENYANLGEDLNGGGIAAFLSSNEDLIIENCRIRDNEAESTGGGIVRGGGLSVFMGHSAYLKVENTEIDGNTLRSGGILYGGGIHLATFDSASADLIATHVVDNSAIGPRIVASGANLETQGASSLTIERSGFLLNTASGDATPQVETIQTDTSVLTVRDSGVGWADDIGMRVSANGSSEAHLVNLTVADNATTGISLHQGDSATLTLYNSIAYGNGRDAAAAGTVTMGFNLLGIDPMFANSEEFDYRLRPGSPAEDAGTNTPPGGLGSTDFGGNPRIEGGTVDIGMYEGVTYDIFSDGFESGVTDAWSTTVQ